MDPTPDRDPALLMLPESLRRLAARGVVKRYPRGMVLIHEGDQGDTLFILLAGRVKVYSSDSRGREIVHGVYGAGEYLGEMSLDGGPRSASVVTLEPLRCAVVTRVSLQAHIAESPEFAFDLLAKVIRRARAATLSAKQLALNDVYGRLAALLNGLAHAQPDGARIIHERLTHLEMANRLGCSREMVSRLMKDLENGEIIERRGTAYRILRELPQRW
jgi:CRP/FNR family transcriptional regulator, cyclic AMP receptor protein